MKFGNTHYVPFLKGKMGEYGALRQLSDDAISGLTPLVDIPAMSSHAKGPLGEYLDTHARKLARHWGTEPFFLDLHDLPLASRLPNGRHHVEYLHALVHREGMSAIPVTGLDRDDDYNDAVREASALSGQLAIRLLPEDLATPSLLASELGQLIREFDHILDAVHLMFDLRSLRTTSSVAETVSVCRKAMAAIKHLDKYASFTVSGSSMPQSLSELVSANDTGRIQRLEVEVWRKLQRGGLRQPSFGDYGAVHPDLLDLNPRKITLAADIRYTCATDTLILRGSSMKHHPAGFGQYHDLARTLIDLPDYRGRTFSWGDDVIYQTAHRMAKGPGNKTTWVKIATNHHLELVTAALRGTSEAA